MAVDKTHVLHLRNTITNGGAEKLLINWFRHVDRRHFTFSLACFANPGNLESLLLGPIGALDVPTFRLPWGRRKRIFSAVDTLVRVLREHRVSVLHSHDAKSDVVAWLAHLRTGVPVVGSAYAWFGTRSVKRAYIYEWLDAHLLNQFAVVIAISRGLIEESVERGIDRKKLRFIRSGVDFHGLQCDPDRAAVRRRLGLGENDFVIGNLARLWPEKGHSVLLDAMKQVMERSRDAKLVIVGEGPLEEDLKQQAEALGIGPSVVFAGFPDNLPEILNVLDMQVHSSHYEGIPIAILQGMATGLPIVATDVGGVHEVLTSEQNALLVPAGDPTSIANAVLRIKGDAALSSRLGKAARAYAEETYSMESTMEQLAGVYREVCAAHRSRSRTEK